MLEIFEVTDDNVVEVAKACGQREADIRVMLEEAKENNKPCKIWTDTPDNIPGDFMRSGR